MAEASNAHPVPGSWYELSAHVDHALAVNNQMGPDVVPIMNEINEVGSLAGAVGDILRLIRSDVEALYDQLNKGAKRTADERRAA